MLGKGKPKEIVEADTGEIVNEHTDYMWKKGYNLNNLPNYRTQKAECMALWGHMDRLFGSQSQTQSQEVEPDEPGAGHGAGETVTVVEGEGAASHLV